MLTALLVVCAFVIGFSLSTTLLYFPLLAKYRTLKQVTLQGLDNQIALLKRVLGVKEEDGSMVSPIQITKEE